MAEDKARHKIFTGPNEIHTPAGSRQPNLIESSSAAFINYWYSQLASVFRVTLLDFKSLDSIVSFKIYI